MLSLSWLLLTRSIFSILLQFCISFINTLLFIDPFLPPSGFKFTTFWLLTVQAQKPRSFYVSTFLPKNKQGICQRAFILWSQLEKLVLQGIKQYFSSLTEIIYNCNVFIMPVCNLPLSAHAPSLSVFHRSLELRNNQLWSSSHWVFFWTYTILKLLNRVGLITLGTE